MKSVQTRVSLPRNQLLIHIQGLISRAKWVQFSALWQSRENKASITTATTAKNTFPPKNSTDKGCTHQWGKMTYCMVEMMWWWCWYEMLAQAWIKSKSIGLTCRLRHSLCICMYLYLCLHLHLHPYLSQEEDSGRTNAVVQVWKQSAG